MVAVVLDTGMIPWDRREVHGVRTYPTAREQDGG